MPKGRLELTWMGKDQALIAAEHGKYDYEWVDSSDPRASEVKAINMLGSYGVDPEDNLLITGDSGDVLRTLVSVPEWADKYRGKVKLVYIDPPFNTDQTFTHYADALEHSVWLTLMRDRLVHIKDLLTEDGSVWVHLDDSEVHRMRSLLDEVFGPDAHVATIVWENFYGRSSAAAVSTCHNYILCYSPMGESKWRHQRNLLPREGASLAKYQNPDNDPRGPWRAGPIFASEERHDGLMDARPTPSGKMVAPPKGSHWRMTRDVYDEMVANGSIIFGVDGKGAPATKLFLAEVQDGLVPRTWWPHGEVGHSQEGKREIQALFPEIEPFSTPKPERLLERVISIGSNPGEIVLDCFAGSGTTAAVAHKLGRRWVAVELSESTVTTFTRPRLEKVVDGESGGISRVKTRVAAEGVDLPEGVSPEQAATLVSTLAKFGEDAGPFDAVSAVAKMASDIGGQQNSPLDPHEAQELQLLLKKLSGTTDGVDVFGHTLKDLRTRAKTRMTAGTRWQGGGGFMSASMSPSMYEVIDGDIYLSELATNGAFSQAIAGQLRYRRLTDDPVFCGVKGRSKLAVVDGVADENVVRTVVQSLDNGAKALIVAKAVLPEAVQLLQELSPGSRLRRAPDDLFTKGTVK